MNSLRCPICSADLGQLATALTDGFLGFSKHVQENHSGPLSCGVAGCNVTVRTGSEHLRHLESTHGYASAGGLPGLPPPGLGDNIIFQDPTQEHDVYVSYCSANCLGQGAITSPFHDPKKIAAELSRKFKPWYDNVCLGPTPSGDFYEDRALALQKVKIVVALLSPEYCTSEQCKMEYEFAFKSLKKPLLPVMIRPGALDTTIDSYVNEGGRVPFRLDGNITSQADFETKMEYLMTAVERMISEVDTDTERQRLTFMNVRGGSTQPSAPPACGAAAPSAPDAPPPSYDEFLATETRQLGQNIRERVPVVGDHVISHHFEHAYYTATILRFNRDSMTYDIAWDDNDPSGTVQAVSSIALDRVPGPEEITRGQRVFFPQGSYGATDGNNSGGGRYHEGVITSITRNDKKVRCSGHHLKGEEDGKWITYRQYNYHFTCDSSELRVAANPYNLLHAYANM